MHVRWWYAVVGMAWMQMGCAGATPSPVGAPESSQGAPGVERGTPDDGEAAPAPLPPRADVLYAPAAAVPPPAPDCPSGTPLPARGACESPFDRLAAAAQSHSDAALAELETCRELPVGAVRALRAEFAPTCADQLVAPVVGQDAGEQNLAQQDQLEALDAELRQLLVGLGIGARLRRMAQTPPAAPSSRDKATLEGYFAEELFPWMSEQTTAIYALADQGSRLGGMGRGVVAVEAGMADMRFVELARSVPIPDSIADDPEARDLYYGNLDAALEPRKNRGRDGALVGLAELARAGVHRSERLEQARSLLSRVFGGHRIDALDALLRPALPMPEQPSVRERIVAAVPSHHALRLIGDADPLSLRLESYLQQGLPQGVERSLRASKATPEQRLLLAQAALEQGILYFRREDFQAATQWVTDLLDREPGNPDSLNADEGRRARFVRALGLALSAGPKNAALLIAEGPRFADSLGNLALLDALAEANDPLAGEAAFDAAYLRELVAPPQNASYWNELAARYDQAAARLKGDARKRARQRAQDARATARAIVTN